MLNNHVMGQKKVLRAALAAAAICLLPAGAASAEPVTYVFSGSGQGTINGTAFDGAFSFSFIGDTSSVDTSDTADQFYVIRNIGGTFTEGGTTYSLAANNQVSFSDPPSTPGFVPTVGFLNSDFSNGYGLASEDLAGYELLTSIGPIAVPGGSNSLAPTVGFPTVGFSLDDGADTLVLTGDDSLTFAAEVGAPSAVPEPASIALLSTGLAGMGLLRRRMRL